MKGVLSMSSKTVFDQYTVDVSKLQVGMVFASMNELYRFIGMTGSFDGNSRKSKEKILAYFISWERIPGTRNIVVTEIRFKHS